MQHHVLVRSPAVLELVRADGPALPVDAELRFTGHDPYAVALAIPTLHSREVVWRFSRGLLAQGLIESAGMGDVRLRPLDTPVPGGVVEIELRSPGGCALFHAPRSDLRGYLARTQELIPFGAEYEWLDLDHTIAMLRIAPPRSGMGDRFGCSARDERSPTSRNDRSDPSGPPQAPRGC